MEFKPGDTVPQSGIYRVDHESHRVMHEAKLSASSRFPRCRHCKDGVRFHLLQVADDGNLASGSEFLLEEYSDPKPPLAAAV
jgi:hypothetical protein